MNRTSASTVSLEVPTVVYEGLLTGVGVTVTGVKPRPPVCLASSSSRT